jgi:DNA helicase-2/ATP-dependent DNA helicase PcrA
LTRSPKELIDPALLVTSGDTFLEQLGRAHAAYEAALIDENRVDFAHIQKFFLDILDDETVGADVRRSIRYVMVDEYQDTNYIQERLLDRLSTGHGNLCVVGDEDQALYRFRGATVRNILEFSLTHPDTTVIKMTTNYRSHEAIVAAYDKFMAAANWSNPTGGPSFRFEKTIEPNPEVTFPDYPAVFSIWGTNRRDEAHRFASLVAFPATNGVIEDYSRLRYCCTAFAVTTAGPVWIEANGDLEAVVGEAGVHLWRKSHFEDGLEADSLVSDGLARWFRRCPDVPK